MTYGSHRKVWWRCAAGHSWQAMVYVRSGGSGCPYCTHRRPAEGETTLQDRFPALAAEWDREKNPGTPAGVMQGSHRIVWWRCPEGHSYRAAVRSRTRGTGCPYCAGRAVLPEETSLAARYPLLAAEWDAEKNGALTPRQTAAGSHRRVWWRCARGHSWQATVVSRSYGTGCPYCAGKRVIVGKTDLATCAPQLAAEWDGARNGALTPQSTTAGSNRAVWWRCERGHSYRAVIASRTQRGSGCPYCAGMKVLAGFNDLAALHPRVAAEWHPTLNAPLTPQEVTAGSARRVWWQCPFGHVWRAVIYSRTGGRQSGCPVCAGHTRERVTPSERSEVYDIV